MTEDNSTRCVAIVVEDEWLVRMELADALAGAGLDVLEAASGEEAVACLEQLDHIHLLVTDIRLSGEMTGWDVAEAYRAARPRVAVIYASANLPLEARQVPGSVFFAKPAPIDELLRISRSLCQQAMDEPGRGSA